MDSRMIDNPDALKQLDEVIAPLDRSAFRHCCELLPGGTVGGHVRHCIEFYQCLFAGIDSGEIDYDARSRNPDIESCPVTARQAIRQLLATEWARLGGMDHDQPLRVRESLAGWQVSSLGREFGFAFSHTIHHLALIGVLLRDHGRCVEDGIGLAPSTERHFARQAAD